MTHGEVRADLGDYLEGDLPLERRALVDAHLDGCAECAQRMRSLRSTVDTLRALDGPEPPAGLSAAVLARIEAGEGRPGALASLLGRIPWELRGRLAAPALAFAAAAVLRVWLYRPAAPPELASVERPPLPSRQSVQEAIAREESFGASADLVAPAGPRVASADLDAARRDPASVVRALAPLSPAERQERLAALARAGDARVPALADALAAQDAPDAKSLAQTLLRLYDARSTGERP